MKTLFFCNTNYQLIVAMQIVISLKKEASIIVSNSIKNWKEIISNLKETGLFEQVVYFDVKAKDNSFKLIRQCVYGYVPDEIKNCIFDEFVGFNFDIPSHMVFAFFYKKNRNIVVRKMEEGLMSLNTSETSCRVIDVSVWIRHALHKKNLRSSISGIYCFSPKANTSDIPSIQIPLINKESKIKDYLNKVFCANRKFEYQEKYIFLSCIYDIEGGEAIGEFELAKAIANKVGKNNLLIKVHPRDDKEKYISSGLKVDENSSVPFEVIQINNDFSDKILITTLSGSILNFNSVLENVPISYYGYKLCSLKGNLLALHYKDVLEQYINDSELGLRNIKILESIEELDYGVN